MGNHHSRDRRRGDREPSRSSFLNELFGSTGGQRGKPDHKTAMLCRQVQRAISLALGGELNEPSLSGLSVGEVAPAPNASHLLVELIVPADFSMTLPELLTQLEVVAPRLRHLVTQSISRKRAPSLSFVPVAPSKGGEA